AEERGVAKADETAESHQQVKAHREDRQHQRLGHKLRIEGGAEPWHGQQRRAQCKCAEARRVPAHPPSFPLRMPSGRTNSTKAITRYTTSPAKSGSSTLPNGSVKPMSSDARNAPPPEPMPPITTITNDTISTWLPMP